jgi:hydroxymethylglutaryl-CoA reductase (NADPH)
MFVPKKRFTFFLRTHKIKKLYNKRFISLDKKRWGSKYLESQDKFNKLECVKMRREMLGIENLSYNTNHNFYQDIYKKNCENVIGFVKIPVGTPGKIKINDKFYNVTMATTEGTLVASTSRGIKVLNKSGGIKCSIKDNGITRAPILSFQSLEEAKIVNEWISNNFSLLEESFNSTSNYGKLESIIVKQVSRDLYIRISCKSGEAMGMNIITKGSLRLLDTIIKNFNYMNIKIISLSGNYCIDKKPSSINWILGRCKSVTCESIIEGSLLKDIMKVDIDDLINLNTKKNLIGSALSGSIGGFNAHASNIVASIFASTGQDLGQIGTSSVCLTTMEKVDNNLVLGITMPSIEIGTIGGGTRLYDQKSCIDIIDKNLTSMDLGKVIAGTVMAGELSLMSSLCNNTLVNAHLKLNRGIN